MSSQEASKNNGLKTSDRKAPSSPKSDEEPTDLVINIKAEPKEDEYYEDSHSNGVTGDDQCEDFLHHTGESFDESESDYYKEIDIPQVAVTQESETVHRRVVVSPCIPSSAPDEGAVKPLKVIRSSSTDWLGETRPSTLASRRLLPINIKSAGPIPIALTLSKSGTDAKTNSSTLHSQATAHHLMTLATEADKILKKQEKRLKSEKGSGSDHTDEGKQSTSEEEMMCSSSDSSAGGVDSFLNSGDQTLTLIQRRAAEASLSNTKKSKRKRSQLPDDMKDETYWERRRKNNEAAKRSRDARRAKEDQIAIRAALLEQENMRLRIEVAALKEETVRLKGMLYEKR